MTTLSPDERADELRCIAYLLCIAAVGLLLAGHDDYALAAFVAAFHL